MHQRSPSELQRASSRRTAARAGAPLWTWLLLGALAVPGTRSYLSEDQEELLVELHNYYRGQVSPSASAMLPLRWDPNLKVIAEGYAAKCRWNHNPELNDIGENLFVGTGPLDLGVALEKWFLEHLDFDFQNNTCQTDQMCGHYTQMVWADTHRVGCAFHLCNNMEGLDWERASFLVCNYFPAGNYEDQRPFVEGEWCSRCPENLQKCENNLCVADTVENDDDEREGVDYEESPVPTGTSPSISTITAEGNSADLQPPATLAPGTQPPENPPTPEAPKTPENPPTPEAPKTPENPPTPEEPQTPEDPPTPEDPSNEKAVKEERGRGSSSAASAPSAPLLLACVTGLLTLRL